MTVDHPSSDEKILYCAIVIPHHAEDDYPRQTPNYGPHVQRPDRANDFQPPHQPLRIGTQCATARAPKPHSAKCYGSTTGANQEPFHWPNGVSEKLAKGGEQSRKKTRRRSPQTERGEGHTTGTSKTWPKSDQTQIKSSQFHSKSDVRQIHQQVDECWNGQDQLIRRCEI